VVYGTVAYHAHQYTVLTPVYEGPLDLLLQLIEKEELDITNLALAQVTDQYLAHLKLIEVQSPNDVSAFLVVATRLIQIKSEALLPRPPVREPGEEDPGEALAEQLKIYKKFKQIAAWFLERENQAWKSYLHVAPSPQTVGMVDLGNLDLEQFFKTAHAVFHREELKPPLGTVVTQPKVTIREKIGLISKSLRKHSKVAFGALLKRTRTRLEVVVTFLAMLELVKRNLLNAQQDELFGEISLERNEEWHDDMELDLEFGE
jgi:segregation and condensation protein A